MTTRPAGLLAIGDAMASFSPVYGQGMSVAALQALALRACLSHRERATLETRYFRAASRVIDAPWGITVGDDRQLSPGGPHGTWAQRARHRWVQRVLRAGHHDHDVAMRIPERGTTGGATGDAGAARRGAAGPASEQVIRFPPDMMRADP